MTVKWSVTKPRCFRAHLHTFLEKLLHLGVESNGSLKENEKKGVWYGWAISRHYHEVGKRACISAMAISVMAILSYTLKKQDLQSGHSGVT